MEYFCYKRWHVLWVARRLACKKQLYTTEGFSTKALKIKNLYVFLSNESLFMLLPHNIRNNSSRLTAIVKLDKISDNIQ